MTTCALSLRYSLAGNASDDERPRFSIEPHAGDREVKFSASNLRSVDRLDVTWSSQEMSNDGKNPAAVALGKLGGAATTAAKQRAARSNGKKGGRPVGVKDSRPRTRRARP